MRYLIVILGLFINISLFAQWEYAGNSLVLDSGLGASAVWGVNANTVFVAGSYDYIVKVTDQDITPTKIDIDQTAFIYDMQFQDELNGIAVGKLMFAGYSIYRTTDGGSNWTAMPVGPIISIWEKGFSTIDFPSSQVGYIGGSFGRVMKTSNGGASWEDLSDITPYEIIDIDFVDDNIGFLITGNGYFYKTENGGENWGTISLPFSGSNTKMQFFSAEEGIATNSQGIFWKTLDGGATWEIISNVPYNIAAFDFPESSTGYFVTEDGQYFKTIDGGINWYHQANNLGSYMKDIHFVDSETGWVVGASSFILMDLYKTTNGGGLIVDFELPSNSVCAQDTLLLQSFSMEATEFVWEVDSVVISNEPTAIFIPEKNGLNTIKLTASNGIQTNSIERILNVNGIDIIPFEVELLKDSICVGTKTFFEIGPLDSSEEYAISKGDTIIQTNLTAQNQTIEWQTEELYETSEFSFYVFNPGCGWHKLASKTVQVFAPPVVDIDMELMANPLCENESTEIQLPNPEPNISYQIEKDGFPFGTLEANMNTPLTLTSNPIPSTSFLKVKAFRSTNCYRVLEDSVKVSIKNLEPGFAVSTMNLAEGESLIIENTSADSLSFNWTFGEGASIPTSNLQHPDPVQFSQVDSSGVVLQVTSPSGCQEDWLVDFNIYDSTSLQSFWALEHKTHSFTFDIAKDGSIYYISGADLSEELCVGTTAGNGFKENFNGKLLIKHNEHGVLQWVNKIYRTNEQHYGHYFKDIFVDKDQNILVMGRGENCILTSTDGREYTFTEPSLFFAKYSPNGVLLNVQKITCSSGSAPLGISFSQDTLGNTYLAGVNCGELLFHAMDGTTSTYSDEADYFLAKISPEGNLIWGTPYSFTFHFPEFQRYRPSRIKHDQNGGMYVWADGIINSQAPNSYGVYLMKYDSTGALEWQKHGRIHTFSVFTEESYFGYANDLVVDEEGNAIVMGSVFGLIHFNGWSNNFEGCFVAKIAPDGEGEWIRFLRNSSSYSNNNTSNKGYGIAIEDELIYAESYHGDQTFYLDSFCHDEEFEDANLYVSIWDGQGNLLNIIPSKIGGNSSHTPNQPASTIRVKNDAIYSMGPNIDGHYNGYPLTQSQSHSVYMAKVPDTKDYLPYISLPPSTDAINCEASICTHEGKTITISDYFENIQWYLNDEPLEGATSPTLFPPETGFYSALATHPNGTELWSPHEVFVFVAESAIPVITRFGPALATDLVEGAEYVWSNLTVGYALIGAQADGNIAFPPESGLYRVSITTVDGCYVKSEPFYFDADLEMPVPTISGVCYFDQNQNQIKDPDEPGLFNQSVSLDPNAVAGYTDNDGIYRFFVENGNYSLSPITADNWMMTTAPISYEIDIQDTVIQNLNFGFLPIEEQINIESSITSAPTRCGFEVPLWLNYGNTGTTFESGYLTFELDALTSLVSASPVPDSISGHTLFWFYNQLPPSHSRNIEMIVQMPGVEYLGEDIIFSSTTYSIDSIGTIEMLSEYQFSSTINCAYDPNDKLVFPNSAQAENYTLFGEELEYTIRFQNTGTDTAFTVKIQDQLDENLDWSSFRPVTASHPYQAYLSEDGLVEFVFHNILLPDSTTNEVQSHGFVKYRIKPLEGLDENTPIYNTADIFFDYNPPIQTNTTLNTLVSELPTSTIEKFSSISVKASPNPFMDRVNLIIESEESQLVELKVSNISGQMVYTKKLRLKEGNQIIELSAEIFEEAGVYIYSIIGEGGVLSGRLIKVE